MTETRKVSDLTWREDLYPRFEPIPAKIQEYAEVIELLPPIEINQHDELIDGYHRWTAHRKAEIDEINVSVTQTKSDADLLALAYERNASFGISITPAEKKRGAIRMYADGTGRTEEEIANLLHVKLDTVQRYLARIKKENKEHRNERIWNAWLSCDTEEEIAERERVDKSVVSRTLENVAKSDAVRKRNILANYQDADWKPPLYDVWKQQNKSNQISHFGNTEVRWLDNLLYMYTEPYDIVVDPLGGGGSTIDVCKKRLRRYWVSDRLPPVERRDIRQHDIMEGPPNLHKRWGDVKLLYLDPPYWKQAEGQYSDDPQDLANMELEKFYATLTTFISACAEKMHTGSHIALIIQPTQWNAPDRQVIDHTIDLIAQLKDAPLEYVRRISCPYESQQCNAQMVQWAKENKEILVINREITVWRAK